MFYELSNDNLTIFAANHYHNNNCHGKEEFLEDLNRFKYLKKLINKYLNNDKENYNKTFRLIINHIIIIFNVFDHKAAHHIMKFKLDDEQMGVVKTCLISLGLIKYNEYPEIQLNKRAIEACRKI